MAYFNPKAIAGSSESILVDISITHLILRIKDVAKTTLCVKEGKGDTQPRDNL